MKMLCNCAKHAGWEFKFVLLSSPFVAGSFPLARFLFVKRNGIIKNPFVYAKGVSLMFRIIGHSPSFAV